MGNVDKELLAHIRKIKLRVHRNAVLNFVVWGIVIALCIGCLVSIGALLIPLYKVYAIILKIVLIVTLIALFIGLIKIPKNSRIVKLADSLGLKERTTTAVELIGREDGFARLQKQDALKSLKELDYKSELVFKIDKRQLALILTFVFIIVCSGFIPTPAKSKAEEKYKFEIMKEEKLASISSIEKELKKSSSLNEEDKKELLDNLATLKKELKESKSINDIDNAMTKFQIKTDSQKEKFKENDLNNVVSGLSRNEATSNLAQAVENGDKEGISREISKLPEIIQNASDEEKKKIAQDFANMANSTGDSKLKDSLNDIAKKLVENNNENKEALSQSFKEFGSSLQNSVDNRDAKMELKGIQNEFIPSKGSNSEINNPSNNSSSKDPDNKNNADVTPDVGDNPSQNPDKNSEGSNNQGSNSSDNKGNNSQDSNSGFNKPSNNDSSKQESVYLPSNEGSSGSSDGNSGTTPAVPNKPQSLDSVIGKYKDKAYESMNSYVIPEAMKDIIKSYFSSLEQ